MTTSAGQHAAEASLEQQKDPAEIAVQLNADGEEVFVKVKHSLGSYLYLLFHLGACQRTDQAL
jgi:hypothetical protein